MAWDYLGNEWAVEHLRAHAASGQPRQAYLFTGASGLGRRTLALRFAQALNCTHPPAPGAYCGLCRACKLIAKMEHPDLEIVQAGQFGRDLRIDQIRNLQNHLSLMPYEAAYRVALLLRFEEANPNAANALLKTLEEPPPRVILLLTASSAEELLPTIVSRCEVLRLRPLSVSELAEKLTLQLGIEAEPARRLASFARGRPGAALRYHQNPALLQKITQTVNEHLALMGAPLLERFALAERLAKEKDRENLRFLLENWLLLWRDVLLRSVQMEQEGVFPDWEQPLAAIAGQVDWRQAEKAVAALQRTLALLEGNVNLRLALEVLMLDLPRVRSSAGG